MPYSEKQMKYMWANHPRIARRWAREMKRSKDNPHSGKTKKGFKKKKTENG
jgi:hypothetical protein